MYVDRAMIGKGHMKDGTTNVRRLTFTLLIALGICLCIWLRAHYWLGGRIPPHAEILSAVVVCLTLISALWIKRTVESVQCICYCSVTFLSIINGNRAMSVGFSVLAIWAAYDWIAKAKKRAPGAPPLTDQ